MQTWIFSVASFILPSTSVAEMGALLVLADSVQKKGIHFDTLFDVGSIALLDG